MDIEEKRKYDREYYAKMSAEKKKRKRELVVIRQNTIRNAVREYKQNHPCSVCGESDYRCLDFHHIEDNKEINVADAVRHGWSLDRVFSEIDKCIILCSNCHRKEHREY